MVSLRLQAPRAPPVTSEPSLLLSVVFQSRPALWPPLTALSLHSGLWLVTSESKVRVHGRATAGAQVGKCEKIITPDAPQLCSASAPESHCRLEATFSYVRGTECTRLILVIFENVKNKSYS